MTTTRTSARPIPTRAEVVNDLANAMLYMPHELIVHLVHGIVVANIHDFVALQKAIDVAMEAHEVAILKRLDPPPTIVLNREE